MMPTAPGDLQQRTADPEKADTAMYEDDADDRVDVSGGLAGLDRKAAAAAFRGIADDEGIDDVLSIEAEERLARLDCTKTAR